MKVLIINGSPKREGGNTALILNPFIEGLRDKNVDFEVVNAYDYNIKPCLGCVNCLTDDQGRCSQNDSMDELRPKIYNSEIRVFVTPLYSYSFTAVMKNIIDRLYGAFQPFLEIKDGFSQHPLKGIMKPGKVVLMSSCGNWEKENFDFLIKHTMAILKSSEHKCAGILLRPHAAALKFMKEAGSETDDIFEAARKAAHELIDNGVISKETEDIVSRELLSREDYINKVNLYYKEIMKKKDED